MNDNIILRAFDRIDIVDSLHPNQNINVILDGEVIAEIYPERRTAATSAYAFKYSGATRGKNGVTPIGPTLKGVEAMQRRLISVMFNGDADAFGRAVLAAKPI